MVIVIHRRCNGVLVQRQNRPPWLVLAEPFTGNQRPADTRQQVRVVSPCEEAPPDDGSYCHPGARNSRGGFEQPFEMTLELVCETLFPVKF